MLKTSGIVVYCLCLCLVAIYAFKHPSYNWDMLPYMALAAKMDHKDLYEAHKITYNIAEQQVPAIQYAYLKEGPYRKRMAEDPVDFYRQLPFYAVKPLYTGAIYLFHKAGFSLTRSTVLPSILSYLLIGLLLLYWLTRYLNPFFSLAFSLLVMLSSFMLDIARESTPDCLSALFLFAAFYFIIENPSVIWMFALLLLSVLARLDNIIAVIFILSFLFFSGKWAVKITSRQYLLMLFVTGCSYAGITSSIRWPGWNTLYYPAFLRYAGSAYGYASLSVHTYLSLAVSKIITAIVYSHFTLFILMMLLIIYPPFIRVRKLSFSQLICLLFMFIMLVRFLLFPDLSDRFYTAYYLCTLILLIKKYAPPVAVSKSHFSGHHL